MCLYLKAGDLSDFRDNICPHDITVYKVLKKDYHYNWPFKFFPKYTTPFHDMSVRFNKVLESDVEVKHVAHSDFIFDPEYVLGVSMGFHSLPTREAAEDLKNYMDTYWRNLGPYVVVSARIPQGSTHYKGLYYHSVEKRTVVGYASEYIIYDKVL